MANNPYVNKVIYDGNTLIDLTEDTATADKVLQGYTFHDKSGASVVGTYSGGSGTYQSKTVTPTRSTQTVTPDAGYDALSSVTVNGDNDLVAGNIKNGVEIFGVTGTYSGGIPSTPTAGDTPIALAAGTTSSKTSGSTWIDVGLQIIIPKTGTYRIKRYCWRTNTGSNMGSRLMVGSTTYDQYTTWSGSSDRYHVRTVDLSFNAGDVVKLQCKGTSSYVVNAAYLAACINWTVT